MADPVAMIDPKTEQIFLDALFMGDPVERERFIVSACAGDGWLRSRVEALLRGHDRAEQIFPTEPRAGGAGAGVAPSGEHCENPGVRIGRYLLLEQIGEGGFGMVYMAEQQEPVRRRVALKIIKLGIVSGGMKVV